MANCDPACLPVAPDFSAVGCSDEESLRSGELGHLVFWSKCEAQVTTITDAVEIALLKTDGKVFTSPKLLGTSNVGAAATSNPIQFSCEAEIFTKETIPLFFESPLVDPDGNTDFAAWNEIKTNLSKWNVSWVDCDGNLFVRQDFDTGDVPGFSAQGPINYILPGTSGVALYRGDLKIVYKPIPLGIALTDDVKAALGL